MNNLIEIYSTLKIPFNYHFYNLPLSHYETLANEIGKNKINRQLRELMVMYKHNKVISEKCRILFKNLNKILYENKNEEIECECGFKPLGEEYENCPICNKKIITSKICYYLNKDSSCAIDGTECNKSNKECNKLKE